MDNEEGQTEEIERLNAEVSSLWDLVSSLETDLAQQTTEAPTEATAELPSWEGSAPEDKPTERPAIPQRAVNGTANGHHHGQNGNGAYEPPPPPDYGQIGRSLAQVAIEDGRAQYPTIGEHRRGLEKFLASPKIQDAYQERYIHRGKAEAATWAVNTYSKVQRLQYAGRVLQARDQAECGIPSSRQGSGDGRQAPQIDVMAQLRARALATGKKSDKEAYALARIRQAIPASHYGAIEAE